MLALYLLTYALWQVFGWGGPSHKQVIGNLAFWPVDLLGVAVCWQLARRAGITSPVRRAWWLIGAGLLSYLVGDVLWFVYESVLHSQPYPSVADLFYLAFYPFVLAGILQFPRPRLAHSAKIKALFDGAALVLGALAVVWFILLAPTAVAPGQNLLQVVISIAYPCGDLALIFGVALLLMTKSRSLRGASLVAFTSSLLLFVVADLIYGRLALDNAYAGGDPVDILWIVALSLIPVSAVLYETTATSAKDSEHAFSDAEDSALFAYVATATAFLLMVATIGFGDVTSTGAMAIAAATVVLVLGRLQWVSLSKRRQERYFQALVERVSDYVVVLNADLAPRYASPPLLELVGLPPDALVDELSMPAFVVEEDLPLVLASIQRALSEPDSDASAEVRVRDRNGAVLSMIGVTTNLLNDPAVGGLVVVLHDVTEKARLEQELRHQALHDALTGLPNRALIRDRLDQMLATASRSRSPVAVLFVDLDDFKDVNDSLGHAAGDELLRSVAIRLDSLARGQDTVGRVGGDEFVFLVAGGLDTAVLLAQRILDVMVDPITLDSAPERPISIGTSIGICVGTDAESDPLLRNADLALYQAKSDGKSRFVAFEPRMFDLAQERLSLENDLSSALGTRRILPCVPTRHRPQPEHSVRGGSTAALATSTAGRRCPSRFCPASRRARSHH